MPPLPPAAAIMRDIWTAKFLQPQTQPPFPPREAPTPSPPSPFPSAPRGATILLYSASFPASFFEQDAAASFAKHPLIRQTLNPATRAKYGKAFDNFAAHVRARPHFPPDLTLDTLLSSYTEDLYEEDPRPAARQEITNLLSVLYIMIQAARPYLGMSKRYLSGWKHAVV